MDATNLTPTCENRVNRAGHCERGKATTEEDMTYERGCITRCGNIQRYCTKVEYSTVGGDELLTAREV